MSRFYSHGKFLLTGEYLVLKGALALALPLKLGQSMTVETVCTPSPHHNEFKMITNYIVFAHVSFNATVRLKTK